VADHVGASRRLSRVVKERGPDNEWIFYFQRPMIQEQFPQPGIVPATGRHPPPPRVAGPAEAQLTRKGQLRLLFVLKAFWSGAIRLSDPGATSQACEACPQV
jgi:hypothetical protein